MDKEIWKDILGYEGLYQVSNYGRIKALERYVKHSENAMRLRKELILVPVNRGDGYYVVSLCNGSSRSRIIHRLVAQAFIPNPENKPQVNHKDGDKSNNSLDNLEWVTVSENILHSFRIGIRTANKPSLGKFGSSHVRSKAVLQFTKDGKFIKKHGAIVEASKELCIHRSAISNACCGLSGSAGGYVWKFQ